MLKSRTPLATHSRALLHTTLATLSSPPGHKDLGIGVWEGPTVFTSRGPGSGPETPISVSSQSSVNDSPITVSSSSPSPAIYRPRAIPRFNSPAARSAFTPPPLNSSPVPSGASNPARRIHPFFLLERGAAPTPTKPRYVPDYTSTEAESESSASDSQSSVYSTASSHRSTTHDYNDAELEDLTFGLRKMRVDAPPKTETTTRVMRSRRARNPPEKVDSMPNQSRAMSTMPRKGSTPPAEAEIALPPPIQPLVPVFSLPVDPDPSLPLFTYKDSSTPFTIKFTKSAVEADALVDTLKGNIIGFDMEWPIWGKKTWDPVERSYRPQQGKTALVQLCDEETVILIHLQNGMDLPSKVAALVRDPTKYKLGVQCRGDGLKLVRDFPHHFPVGQGPTSLFELSWMAKAVDYGRIGERRGLIALATLTRGYLGKELDKDPNVRAGNWAGELNAKQRDYSANDVVVAIHIYNALKNLAQERNITLHHDLYCSNLNFSQAPAQPLGPTQSLPANAFTSQTSTPISMQPGPKTISMKPVPKNGARLAPTAAQLGGVKPPTPARMAAFNAFVGGKTCEVIAKEKGVQQTTIESYIVDALTILGMNSVPPEHLGRIWKEFTPKRWIFISTRPLYDNLTTVLGPHPQAEEIEEARKERERGASVAPAAPAPGPATVAASTPAPVTAPTTAPVAPPAPGAAAVPPTAPTGPISIQIMPPPPKTRVDTASANNTAPAPALAPAPTPARVYPSPRVPYPTEAQLGFKPPAPALMAALNDFMSGKDCWTIAEESGVQEETVERYIVDAVCILGTGYVQKSDLERLWTEFPSEMWAWRPYGVLYDDITAVLGPHPQLAEVEAALEKEAKAQAGRAKGREAARNRAIARNRGSSYSARSRGYSSGSSGSSSYGRTRPYSSSSSNLGQFGWRGQ
ncbi:hypothetical protein B9479_006596 [Cryptococcus floricola]|uniref:3'-5' exonuclease domain-containing protein n=1 Tax=Cryptococcus floricola TaxID=2591691 RepID=A0A5D3APP7_9TREE|nr:hypothetical protein B9479_006596 [Cryptococcus floricola]